jgi:glycosyltransferase involved in cell wall biosynthesis
MHRKRVSIVAPCFNEESVLPAFLDRVRAVAKGLDQYDFEFLLVDDGSRDATRDVVRAQSAQDPRVRGVFLSRNFGHQRALTAGLDFAIGDYAILIDSDLQDPPEVIADILARLEEGFNVVHTVRADRAVDSPLKRGSAQLFYAIMRRWVLPELPYNAGDFKGLDREALDAFQFYRERVRFLRGMFATLGFRQTSVTFKREARFSGTSKYPLRAVLRLARDAVVSNTVLPLRVGGIAGLAMLVLSCFIFAWGMLSTKTYLFGLQTALMLLIGGLILCMLATIGEYLKVIMLEVKRRPLYIVRELCNVAPHIDDPRQPGV